MAEPATGAACGAADVAAGRKQAVVRCNVRRFREQVFTVRRCRSCRSIHAVEPADLAASCAGYPIHGKAARRDPAMAAAARQIFRSVLRILRRAGVGPGAPILDFGCGDGRPVRFLRRNGHPDAAGDDPFVPAFADARVLARGDGGVLALDVVEPVDRPADLFGIAGRCLGPDGLLLIGPPRRGGDPARARAVPRRTPPALPPARDVCPRPRRPWGGAAASAPGRSNLTVLFRRNPGGQSSNGSVDRQPSPERPRAKP